jgi:hypothetical protein
MMLQACAACPACQRPDALVPLGTRRDHPRWRPWITLLTRLYLCDTCHALVEMREPSPTPAPAHRTPPRSLGHVHWEQSAAPARDNLPGLGHSMMDVSSCTGQAVWLG